MLIQLQRFLKNESGAAAIEYGLLASGISVAIIPAVKNVGTQLVHVFTVLQNAVYALTNLALRALAGPRRQNRQQRLLRPVFYFGGE